MGLLQALALVLLAALLPVQSASVLDAVRDAISTSEVQVLQLEAQTRPHKVFVIIFEEMSWFIARKACEDYGMNLATIRSKEEQNTLEQLLKKKGVSSDRLWLGGHDLWESGKEGWSWRVGSHDEPFTYTNWNKGEPNDLNGIQRCLQISSEYNYFWDDLSCSKAHFFVCENEVSVNHTASLTVSNQNETNNA